MTNLISIFTVIGNAAIKPHRLKRLSWLSCLVLCCLPLAASSQQRAVTRVIGIGNTVMADQQLQTDSRGWMQLLPMYFSLDLHFENDAKENLSMQQFLQSGDWEKIKGGLRPKDLVLVSFAPYMPLAENKPLQSLLSDIQKAKARAFIIRPDNGRSTADKGFKKMSGRSGAQTQTSNMATDLPNTPVYLTYHLSESKETRNTERGAEMERKIKLFDAVQIAAEVADALANYLPSGSLVSTKQDIPATDLGVQAKNATSLAGADFIASSLQLEAALSFRRYALAGKSAILNWRDSAVTLRKKLMEHCGAKAFPGLDVDLHETGRIQRNGYSIRKIYFQTRPGIYATANLYVPDGRGPFPAVINSHGHWPDGKAGDMVQACAISLAQNGYVCLNMDAWGAGERTTEEDLAEYHGANLGASLLDIGESLLGNQVSDNMRGVDLLCSIPFVDSSRIGATGASGGGNQTMWLSALDTRIKTCMPVVSVGTFQSYIMGSNCVCELMPAGLTLTEESGVLALIAPRFLKICSGLQDPSATFAPTQMLRSYREAANIFEALDKKDHIRYQLFNTPHGYFPEMRAAMLGWFNLTLKNKGDGGFAPEKSIDLLPATQLSVFHKGRRSPLITTTVRYDAKIGRSLNARLIDAAVYRKLDADKKRAELKVLLGLGVPDAIEPTTLNKSDTLNVTKLAGDDRLHHAIKAPLWQKGKIFTRHKHVIPYRLLMPKKSGGRILIVCLPDSSIIADTPAGQSDYQQDYLKKNFANLIRQYQQSGDGVIIADLWGLGAAGSAMGRKVNGTLPLFHTLARADIWFGRTVLGEWVSDLNVVSSFVTARFQPRAIDVAAGKEVAVAALATNALYGPFANLYLDHLPVDYVVDERQGIDYFNIAIHLPGMLNWGNVSLIAALGHETHLKVKNPVSITGKPLNDSQKAAYRREFKQVDLACGGNSQIWLGDQNEQAGVW